MTIPELYRPHYEFENFLDTVEKKLKEREIMKEEKQGIRKQSIGPPKKSFGQGHFDKLGTATLGAVKSK